MTNRQTDEQVAREIAGRLSYLASDTEEARAISSLAQHLIAAATSAARREERERCAKVADNATRNIEAFENDVLYPNILGRNEAAKEIASTIRSSDERDGR